MQINLLNEYYKSRSIDQNITDLVNMYLEIETPNKGVKNYQQGFILQHGKYQVTGIQSPGKSAFNTGSGSVVRGSIEHLDIAYAVVDNTFYSYASDGTRTSIGTLSTSTGTVQLASISTQIGIVDGTNIYNYNVGTTTFTTVSDPDAPTSPITITAQDETFLVTSASSVQVHGSDIADGTSWSALSFGSKSTNSDYIQRDLAFKSRLWVIGTYFSEIWYNSGAATFSFELVQGSVIPYGTPSRQSVAAGSNAIYMLAQSKRGGRCVLSMNDSGVTPTPNQAINYQINKLTTISDAIGYCYEMNGHEFYMLVFPTEGVSFEYDITSDVWISRKSLVNAAYTRDLGNCYMYCYGKHLVGAYNSGTLYSLDDTVYTENGALILKKIVSPPAYAAGKKLFLDRLQVDTEKDVGSSLTFTLDISTDSGHSFVDTYTNTIPAAGGRMYWTRLGMTQDAFVIALSTTVDAKVIVLGAVAEIRTGIH